MDTEAGLMARCQTIEGFTLGQLASLLQLSIPEHALQRKGWTGSAIEKALGADAGNQALPDFIALGIELKTIPMNQLGKPRESTFVTSIPMLTIQQQTWETSQCWRKLKKVLWVPIEGDPVIPFAHRRIGKAKLWTPSAQEENMLANDWQELTALIALGQWDELTAEMGKYLQVRPKAAHGQALCYAWNAQGEKVLTLPRGFYLRSTFTASILS